MTLKTAGGSSLGTESIQYGPAGNILGKGSFTNYQYTHANRPHQVSAVTTPAEVRNYSYDANGNLTQVTGPGARTVTWWSFNKPRRMERDGSNFAEYWYGPGGDRAMFRQYGRSNGQTVVTLYGSALYERRQTGMSFAHTHYVQAQGATVATIERSGTSTTNTTRYWHRDHLGSVVAITDEAGTVIERLAYDAWGKRRPAATWQTPTPGVFIAAIGLTRGFTGHEHLDQVGLIHMGGRVYDPEIGRFLSPDPFVQFPASTQGFNRYAYVSNNPLSYTDPSGYFLKKLMKVAGIGMNFVPGWTLMGNAFIHGFVSGFLASGGDVKAGMMGMMSAGIAGEIGGINDLSNFQRSALHGITQGAISAAGGGRFGDGALGAFAGSYLSFIPEAVAGPYGSGGEWAKIGRMTAAAVVGGTASALGGGKFANGAWSAAFVSRFNHDSKFRVSGKGLRSSLDAIGNTEMGQNVISQLESDPLISKVVVGQGSVPGGGLGHTATIADPGKRSLLDVLLGRVPAHTYTVQITINEAADRVFYDVAGSPFRPSTTRVLAHELGHAFARSRARFFPTYDRGIAVQIENAIYLQIRPGAPVRHPTLGHSDAHGGF